MGYVKCAPDYITSASFTITDGTVFPPAPIPTRGADVLKISLWSTNPGASDVLASLTAVASQDGSTVGQTIGTTAIDFRPAPANIDINGTATNPQVIIVLSAALAVPGISLYSPYIYLVPTGVVAPRANMMLKVEYYRTHQAMGG